MIDQYLLLNSLTLNLRANATISVSEWKKIQQVNSMREYSFQKIKEMKRKDELKELTSLWVTVRLSNRVALYCSDFTFNLYMLALNGK